MKNAAKPTTVLVDVSNSFTKIASYKNGRIGAVRRVPTREWTPALCARELAGGRGDTRVVACSVVPRVTAIFQKKISGLTLLTARSPLAVGIRYPKPETIGADRLANASAAAAIYGSPAVVVDFGTAVTFDVVGPDGFYEGGVIAPGMQALTDYLHEKTALLPRVRLREPKRAVGRSTEEAMLSGAVIGYAGLIDAIVRAVLAELKSPGAQLIATGGDAKAVVSRLEHRIVVDPLLTLRGLALLADQTPLS